MTMTHVGTEYVPEMPVGRIQPDPLNPRKHVTVDDDFIASIAAGIIEPLVVRPDPDRPTLDGIPGSFLLVAGERRHIAAGKANLTTVPVIVRHDLDNITALEMMLVENGQRADLTPLEEATAYQRLAEMGRSQRQIAAAVGVKQPKVNKRLALLRLPERARMLIDDGRIGVENAHALTGLLDHYERLDRVIETIWTHKDLSGADIARLIAAEVTAVKRAKADNDLTARRAELVARGMVDLDALDDDDRSWDHIDAVVEADAQAFEITANGDVCWYRLASQQPAENEKHEKLDRTDKPAALTPTSGGATPLWEDSPNEDWSPDAIIAAEARDYVAARLAAHEDPTDLAKLIAVDSAWEHLRLACGYSHTDFDNTDLSSTVVATPTEDIATIEEPARDSQLGTNWTEEPAPVVSGVIETDTDGTDPVLPELDEPWRGYETFGARRNIKVINGNSPWANSPEQLQTIIDYELARDPSRQQIIDAAQRRLDQLATADA